GGPPNSGSVQSARPTGPGGLQRSFGDVTGDVEAAPAWKRARLATCSLEGRLTFFAQPSRSKRRISHPQGSTSHQYRPFTAELGNAWWLLCQPSPPRTMPSTQLLRLPSAVSNLRVPNTCANELSANVACWVRNTRAKPPHSSPSSAP